MCAFQLFLGADPSFGRVDCSSPSDQTLMEMLIDGFDDETKKMYQDKHGTYLGICEWSCVTCDEDESAVKIDVDSTAVSGSLKLRRLPPKVSVLIIRSLQKSKLTGSVDLAHLPGGIEFFFLDHNQLTGDIDLAKLPERIKELYLQSNQLTGESDLTQLPDGMKVLKLDVNHLTGKVDLTHLPDGMKVLKLDINRLSGEVDLTHLPDGMEWLSLADNQLTGKIDLTRLPDGMQLLDLSNNQLTGDIERTSLPGGMQKLDFENSRLSGSLAARKLIARIIRQQEVTSWHHYYRFPGKPPTCCHNGWLRSVYNRQ